MIEKLERAMELATALEEDVAVFSARGPRVKVTSELRQILDDVKRELAAAAATRPVWVEPAPAEPKPYPEPEPVVPRRRRR
jgi:hypothetical protein